MDEVLVREKINEIEKDQVRAACDAILESDAFTKAHRMRRLFRFLVEQAIAGEDRNTNEQTIGIEVFDRDASAYMPGEDPIVRVQVGRLRQRLDAYYAANKSPGNIEISIPVGSYMPVIQRASLARHEEPMLPSRLMVQPVQCIAVRVDGQAFAHGLYEELVNQLFRVFGDVLMAPASLLGQGGNDLDRHGKSARSHHLIESSLRIDTDRIRASIRLVDSSFKRIAWARHFDCSVQFGIQQQEELATSICSALKPVFSALK
ncbi:hypothetical protein [Acidovorax sp. SUPP3334]|uniref:hypothetical protein n=1 Tax=Acidovorax sp. SUPP3334 TaxID=2920881 RepID=UPI0023DE1D5D|nr:hypothetical protein [Acidovorax sp. SUPP3334]GKT26517.1 hypothetical protein AVHM3334_21245 [Acidovorax sp. SUPP3334]